MNALKSVLILLAMVMIVDGMSRDGKAESIEKSKCERFTEVMSERYARIGYNSITVDCKRLVVVDKQYTYNQ